MVLGVASPGAHPHARTRWACVDGAGIGVGQPELAVQDEQAHLVIMGMRLGPPRRIILDLGAEAFAPELRERLLLGTAIALVDHYTHRISAT